MISLFSRENNIRYSIRTDPTFDYINRRYENHFENFVTYYNTRVYAVHNQHILVQLLTSISTPFQYQDQQFVNTTLARTPYIGRAFDLNSSINEGRLYKGQFYGPLYKELYILQENYFSTDEVRQNWKRVAAVNVIYHTCTTLSSKILNGRNFKDSGEAIITIDLALLVFQYKCFLEDQVLKNRGEYGGALGTIHFIHMYVLPNMIYSHASLLLVNRLKAIFYGAPLQETDNAKRIVFDPHEDKVDVVIKTLMSLYKGKSMDYVHLLKAIPSFWKTNAFNSLFLNDTPETIQGSWSFYLARLEYFIFIKDFLGSDGFESNQKHLNRMRLDTLYMKNSQALRRSLTHDRLYDVLEMMTKLI